MKILKFITAVLALMTGIYILADFIFPANKQAAAVGIIGSSDGPTAIFVTGAIAVWKIISAVALFCISVITNICLHIKIRRK